VSALTQEIKAIDTNIETVKNLHREKEKEKLPLDERFERLSNIVKEAAGFGKCMHELEDELLWAHSRVSQIAAQEDIWEMQELEVEQLRVNDVLEARSARFEASREESKRKITTKLQHLDPIHKEGRADLETEGAARESVRRENGASGHAEPHRDAEARPGRKQLLTVPGTEQEPSRPGRRRLANAWTHKERQEYCNTIRFCRGKTFRTEQSDE
jgi:hypothetical protein